MKTEYWQVHPAHSAALVLKHSYLIQGRLFLFPAGNGHDMTAINIFILKEEQSMAFFTSAIDTLKSLVIALGAGLGAWGVINLLEGYGNDNPGANAHVR